MELTGEQLAIVTADARDVVVSAGAGTGKTRVLVERYVRLLGTDRIPEIVAVTFTEAAATEMRERVRRAVLENESLSHHRVELDEALIGTIHALCLQILHEYPVEAGIDPRASVLAEDESQLLLLSACADALEAAAEGDDVSALALREIGIFSLNQQLPSMVARRNEVYDAFDALPGSGPTDWAPAIQARLDAALAVELEAAREPVAERVAWVAAQRLRGGDDALTARVDQLVATLGDAYDGEWWDWGARLTEAAGHINLQGGSKRNWAIPVSEVKASLREVREIAAAIEKLPHWNEHDELALQVLESLRQIFDDASDRYAKVKRGSHALDFLDLEIEAVKLLREHPAVAADFRARLKHVMVDEVQDTNPPQVELIRLLVGDRSDAASPSLFVVGDVKQSIYRFRGADVRQFNRLRQDIQQRGGKLLPLSQSFRTHDTLVDRINAVFESLFANATEDFEAAMESMTGRGGAPPAGPHVTITPISNDAADGTRAPEGDQRRLEADLIAGQVRALLEEPRSIWDGGQQQYRPARPSDVAILLRRLKNLHTFEQALEAHEVPYGTPSGAGFFTRQEVRDLTNLLSWLAQPDDEIALTGALRSPLFMIDDATLLALREQGGSLIRALSSPPDGVDPNLLERLGHAAAVLGDLRRRAARETVHEVLEQAIDATGFEAAWTPLRGGDQAVANIRKLTSMARTLAAYSLEEFALYLRRRRDELDVREGQAGVDRGDAVRLMTVHSAKGLEFPIVFVPEAHLASWNSSDSVSWRQEDGISVTLQRELGEQRRRRPGFYDYLAQLDSTEEAAEHKRLFYVAATRAADYLFVSGDESGSRGWLHGAREALAAAAAGDAVDIRPEMIVDLEALKGRARTAAVQPPAIEEETEYVAPLLARPRVIPVRTSTPVTALRGPGHRYRRTSHSDGLGALRGTVAHRAIEQSFTSATQRPVAEIVREESAGPLNSDTVAAIVSEVAEMVERFEESDLAAILRSPDTMAYFELPFAWDWNGVPVHGSIDLAYQHENRWYVIDFKTDRLDGRTLDEVAESYLSQLGLYGRALERAVGSRPALGLLFLRGGELYEPPWTQVDVALTEARERVDTGPLLDPEAASPLLEPAMIE